MKYAYVALALAAAVSAQTRDDIPKCALPCLDKSIEKTTDCETTDYACVCKNISKIQGDATSCVIDKCGADVALNKVLPAAEALCKAQGGGGGDGDATTTEAQPTETEAPTEAPTEGYPTPTEAPVTSSEEVTVSAPVTTSTMVSVVPPPNNNGSQPTSSIITAGAAGVGSIGGLAMLALGALAL